MGVESFSAWNSEQPAIDAEKHLDTPSLSTQELRKLDPDEKIELMQETAIEILTTLAEAGGAEYEDITALYKNLDDEKLIVRREDPTRLLESILNETPLHVAFPEDTRYSNAVIWEPRYAERGLANAYLEGYGSKNGIVTIVGMKPDSNIDIQKMPDASQEFAGLDRAHVYSISGDIKTENIVFVIVRIPIDAFPPDLMTEEEADILFELQQKKSTDMPSKVEFIQRGYLFKPRHSYDA